MSLVAQLRRFNTLLSRHEHILMLSHMRAYSSLFGHIMGSHPAICGYYEMHMGYYSWRSFVRQKLLYFRDEQPKAKFRYMFDKILHNDHAISTEMLDHPRSQVIFALRPPGKTIPSILRLYENVDPSHEFNDARYATDYYIGRLNTLERMAQSMRSGFFYMDAQALVSDSQDTLAALTQWLDLTPALSPDYDIQKKTSQERVGDTSERLGSGQITTSIADATKTVAISHGLVEEAELVYTRVRQTMINACEHGQYTT